MKCYKCQAELSADAKFCAKCGAPQEFTQEQIDKAIQNDQIVITELYNRTYNNVYHTIKAMIKEEDTVIDIAQDTYLKAFASLEQLQDPTKFRAWIKRIAHNKTVDYLRKKKPIMFSQMSADEDGAVEFEDTNVNNLPEVVIDRAETKRLIAEIMDDIPEEQRVAIAMHYLEGIPIKEIAETFGVTENTIKSRLNYGKKKVEVQVKELEKKGTKLYSLAPLPFLLLLFRNQEVHAAELPNFEALRAIENEFGIKKAVQQPQAINTVTQNVSSISSTATKTVAGTASKGIAAKVIAGIVAVAVIGGGVVAVHNKLNNKTEPVAVEEVQQEEPEVVAPESEVVAPESEVVAPESEVEVPAAISIEEFEGTYQCPDTSLEIIITKIDDTTADIVMDNISPNGANAFNQQMIGKLEGEQLVIDFETSENDMGYITKAGDSLNVDISEHYQAKANTYMSGVYLISGNIENSENTENSGNACIFRSV